MLNLDFSACCGVRILRIINDLIRCVKSAKVFPMMLFSYSILISASVFNFFVSTPAHATRWELDVAHHNSRLWLARENLPETYTVTAPSGREIQNISLIPLNYALLNGVYFSETKMQGPDGSQWDLFIKRTMPVPNFGPQVFLAKYGESTHHLSRMILIGYVQSITAETIDKYLTTVIVPVVEIQTSAFLKVSESLYAQVTNCLPFQSCSREYYRNTQRQFSMRVAGEQFGIVNTSQLFGMRSSAAFNTWHPFVVDAENIFINREPSLNTLNQ